MGKEEQSSGVLLMSGMSCNHWLRKNKLTLNSTKTKLMIFGTASMLDKMKDIEVKLEDTSIGQVDTFKYLGMMLDSKVNFTAHVKYIKSKVIPRLKMLHNLKHILSNKVKLILYKSLIVPLFDYGDVVYNCLTQKDSNTLQVLQNSALRAVLNVDYNTHIEDMHKELELDRLSMHREKHTCHMTYKGLNELAPPTICQLLQ